MRFHLLMLIIVVLLSLGMHGMATAAPRAADGGAPMRADLPPGGPAG